MSQARHNGRNMTSNLPPQQYHDEPTLPTADADDEPMPAEYGGAVSLLDSDEEALARNDASRHSWNTRLLSRMPGPLRKAWLATVRWVRGPVPPRPWSIEPFFPKLQTAPLKWMDVWLPKRIHKILALGIFYVCWLLVFVITLNRSSSSGEIEPHGIPEILACTDAFWPVDNGCGINGDNCRPLSNQSVPFRCPASCLLAEVLNPHAVGTYEANYQPLVIGGPRNASSPIESAIYRGDSYICSAAIHAGVVTDLKGGCGVVRKVGQQSKFPSVSANGITSIPFDSYFPLSFEFVPDVRSDCADLRWSLTGFVIVFTILLSLFTNSPAVFFWTLFFALFFHVALVSEPPDGVDMYKLLSICVGRLLPAGFCAYAIYQFCVRRTLTGLRAQFEKTLLWVGGLWVGCLNNYTFDHMPLQRLTPHDLQQPGAITTLFVVVSALILIAVGQAWAIRIEGQMPRYLALYGLFTFVLLILLALPGESLRIHHYILALLLLPGTAMQTRPSLLYQGLLVGLFINGVARWGFAPLIEIPRELLRGAVIGSELPKINVPMVNGSQIMFTWDKFAPGHDGISILVNDVERYNSYLDEEPYSWAWTRFVEGEPEYFRFGYVKGRHSLDYTKAGTWHANGTWEKMQSGPSLLQN